MQICQISVLNEKINDIIYANVIILIFHKKMF